MLDLQINTRQDKKAYNTNILGNGLHFYIYTGPPAPFISQLFKVLYLFNKKYNII